MRRMPRFTYLWPGLPQLWHAGSWTGLVLATGFAVLVDVLLLASFVWVELLQPRDLQLGWAATGLVWIGAAVLSIGFGRLPTAAVSADSLFRGALREYLQGSWFEAETMLGKLLRLAPRDVEARLLLATLLRRTQRLDEALDQLYRVERLRDAERWTREIAAEREQIAEALARQGDNENTEPVAGPQPVAVRQAA